VAFAEPSGDLSLVRLRSRMLIDVLEVRKINPTLLLSRLSYAQIIVRLCPRR
jgi:hypothetical protein